jgi:hypothetical protein
MGAVFIPSRSHMPLALSYRDRPSLTALYLNITSLRPSDAQRLFDGQAENFTLNQSYNGCARACTWRVNVCSLRNLTSAARSARSATPSLQCTSHASARPSFLVHTRVRKRDCLVPFGLVLASGPPEVASARPLPDLPDPRLRSFAWHHMRLALFTFSSHGLRCRICQICNSDHVT